ncbi:MAG: helix-turn-helix domain-containing protein [Hyphomonadaceae bacterium]|nr:helix-turn-helix domain-containing protein [Hyphomonadaceae bacterium]
MEKPLAPEVRSQFAKRLKEMRVRSGFLRARYFAKSLGIEENRYTRYERAEVEPSLTLIHKMCATLQVSPNELLGFAEYAGPRVSGFAENPLTENGGADGSMVRRMDQLAWRLASEAVAVRSKHLAKASGDPLAATRETGKLFRRLQGDPFGTIAEIVADDALKNLEAERKSELADLVESYTGSIAKAAPSKSRR